MITVVCGEDSISSFNYFSSLRNNYQNKDFEVIDINSNDLENINLWLNDSQMLFLKKKVFFTQNISKKLSRKLNLKINKTVEQLIKDKNIELFSWEEEISSRFLKFPNGIVIKEFKPNQTIFKLQDALFPGNIKTFTSLFNELVQSVDENFIFIMLARHLKNLLLIKTDSVVNKLQKWQVYKLKNLASKWEQDKLINFYDAFHKIDLSQKTSTNPYSIKKSLDIIACYYL